MLGIVDVDRVGRRLARARSQVILGRVRRDPVQPGVKLAVAAKAVDRAVRLDEGVLGDILAFRLVGDEAADQVDHLVLVLLNQ